MHSHKHVHFFVLRSLTKAQQHIGNFVPSSTWLLLLVVSDTKLNGAWAVSDTKLSRAWAVSDTKLSRAWAVSDTMLSRA